ncbi:MAG: hypothetical protein HN742_03105 [Lentisphaerae bacterium]|jgi:hypothetical protein|nr:hypothetical protein [Lentisphaerota bacterium]MBT4814627.1 hypothetical protein [Lentisphaerota bacterium]MBT5605458.1 hypothetical protein [Lentisphaerota bacterium]MBT7060111.1 hypothetical protein [Lentisphaerota bacterium]MBT7840829.1 hypothetical protein [Lentisphaerota bacterium]
MRYFLLSKALAAILLTGLAFHSPHASAQEEPSRAFFTDSFSAGLDAWEMLNPKSWQIREEDGAAVLVLRRPGKQRPPVRRPGEYALLRDRIWQDVTLTARIHTLRSTKVKGRDVCILFGVQDETHFYYTHVCSDANGKTHNVIMKVKGTRRFPITRPKRPEARLTDEWHTVRVFHGRNGTISVWLDDMETPLMTATDTDYTSGAVGLGSFDDPAEFDDVEVIGFRPVGR